MPDVGEGLTEAEILKWYVQPGDTVTDGQVVCEVETAKAAVELPIPYDGVVRELRFPEGTTVDVGTAIIAVDVSGGAAPAQAAPAESAASGSSRRTVDRFIESPCAPGRAPGDSTERAGDSRRRRGCRRRHRGRRSLGAGGRAEDRVLRAPLVRPAGVADTGPGGCRPRSPPAPVTGRGRRVRDTAERADSVTGRAADQPAIGADDEARGGHRRCRCEQSRDQGGQDQRGRPNQSVRSRRVTHAVTL